MRGDLAFALQSRTDRAINQLNVQPTAATVINGTRFPPPINAAGVTPGDPFTPMMRTYPGDLIRVKMQAGAHEEEHNASHPRHEVAAGRIGPRQVAQLRLEELAGRGHLRAVHAQHAGAADRGHSCPQARSTTCTAWTTATTAGGAAPGASSAPTSSSRRISSRCRQTQVPVVLTAADAGRLHRGLPGERADPRPRHHRGGSERRAAGERQRDGPGPRPRTATSAGRLPNNGRTLVYNHRTTTVGGQTVLVDNPAGGADIAVLLPTHQGPIHDPTALAYMRTSDLEGQGNQPRTLIAGRPIEPLVLRVNAGDCITVTLRNRLSAAGTTDLATLSTLQGVVKRDRFGAQGSTTFQTNLIQPSLVVGLHPQLVQYDPSRADGVLVGLNDRGLNSPLEASRRREARSRCSGMRATSRRPRSGGQYSADGNADRVRRREPDAGGQDQAGPEVAGRHARGRAPGRKLGRDEHQSRPSARHRHARHAAMATCARADKTRARAPPPVRSAASRS